MHIRGESKYLLFTLSSGSIRIVHIYMAPSPEKVGHDTTRSYAFGITRR